MMSPSELDDVASSISSGGSLSSNLSDRSEDEKLSLLIPSMIGNLDSPSFSFPEPDVASTSSGGSAVDSFSFFLSSIPSTLGNSDSQFVMLDELSLFFFTTFCLD